MDVVRAVGLHEIGKTARATDARHGRDLLVPEFALLDELEVKREDGEIAATRAPCRVIGGDLLFGQTFALVSRQRRSRDTGDVPSARRHF